jgi:hypothetical protein
MGHTTCPKWGCSFTGTWRHHLLGETAEAAPQGVSPYMVHDLVLAVILLAMIISPALLTMRSDREESDIF